MEGLARFKGKKLTNKYKLDYNIKKGGLSLED